jgi:glycosyltransferase involved in cell wall biosynthesis
MQLYSVVIPAINAAATLAEAIDSVLAQTIAPRESVVVDDGSTDGTAAVAGRFPDRVRYVQQPNRGPGAATTRGLAMLDTPFAATLDSDDLWLPQKAERQLACLEAAPEVAACFSLLRQFADGDAARDDGHVSEGWSRTTMMMRTTLFAAVGAILDPPGGRGELVDWIARARETGARLEMLDEVLALRRLRAGSLSAGRSATLDRGYLHVAHAALVRRRAKQSDG